VDAIKATTGSRQVWLLPLDLASLTSVRACAAAFLALDEPLHVLVNNAGLGGQRGLTADGFELHFGVNHLGHYALTLLLLDRLTASGPDARIVNVSSAAHYGAPGIDFDALRRRTASFTGQREYAVSKLCNVLFTQELTRRLAGSAVSASALHPGVVASDIWRRVPRLVRPLITARMLTTEQGAVTSLYCATSPSVAADGGRYYDQCAVQEPNPVATPELAELLWRRSATWAGVG
jgi:retinol dehydrogenase-12